MCISTRADCAAIASASKGRYAKREALDLKRGDMFENFGKSVSWAVEILQETVYIPDGEN